MEVPPYRDSWTVNNRKGLNIRVYQEKKSMDNSQITKAVLLCHGLQSRYELEYCAALIEPEGGGPHELITDHHISIAYQLNRQEGLAIFGMDHQGHGRSDSWDQSRTNVQRFDDYAFDVIDVLKNIANKIGHNIPIILVGISLGGAICTRVVQIMGAHDDESDINLQGLVLLAPAISVEHLKAKPMNRILLPFSEMLSRIFPKLRLGTVETHPVYTQVTEFMSEDPLCSIGKIPMRFAAEGIKVCDTIMKEYEFIGKNNPDLKIVFIHSEADGFVDPIGSKDLYALLKLKNKELHILPESSGMWHFLTIEPKFDEFVMPRIQSVIDFVKGATVSPGIARSVSVESSSIAQI